MAGEGRSYNYGDNKSFGNGCMCVTFQIRSRSMVGETTADGTKVVASALRPLDPE